MGKVEFVLPDILPLALGETEQEDRTVARAKSEKRSIAAAPALTCSRNPLFDQAPAKIRIDKPPFGPIDGLDQAAIQNPLSSSEASEWLGLVDRQRLSIAP